MLTANLLPPREEISAGFRTVSAQYENTTARYSGYWLARLLSVQSHMDMAFNEDQKPQRYERGEAFENLRPYLDLRSDRFMWYYRGVPEQVAIPEPLVQISSGEWLQARANPAVVTTCKGTQACTQTGVWQPQVPREHPWIKLVSVRWRQSWVVQGQRFPDPQQDWLLAEVAPDAVTWRLIEAGSVA